jgi:hypothetical protein
MNDRSQGVGERFVRIKKITYLPRFSGWVSSYRVRPVAW